MKDFKPHMMYDKSGKGYKANTYEQHLAMKKKGYGHTKPTTKKRVNKIIRKKIWRLLMPKKASQKSLDNWTREKWGTKSGKPSLKTGERYLPKAAREALTDEEYARTSRKKREGMRAGKQFVKQPKKIAEKTAEYRSKKRLLKSARKRKS